MTDGGPPIVLVIVDENSRLSILRHEGVMVGFLDKRVDPLVVILPEVNQPLEIDAAMMGAVGPYPILSTTHDDEAHSGSAVASMLDRGRVVVASGPEVSDA